MVTEAELKSYEAEAKRTFERFKLVAELYHEQKTDKLLVEYTETLKEFAKANKLWIKAHGRAKARKRATTVAL